MVSSWLYSASRYTTLFLKNKEQIPSALQTIKLFSQASGPLRLKLDKCELMSIHNCSYSSLYNIPVKKETKYLGIWITKCSDASQKKIIQNIVDKCKKNLNNCLQRFDKRFDTVWENITNKNGNDIKTDLPCVLLGRMS